MASPLQGEIMRVRFPYLAPKFDNMTAEFINTLNEVGQLDFFYVSLISADTLTSIGACENSERLLNGFKDVLEDTELSGKEKWYELITDGLKIVKREKTLKEGK